MPTQIPEVPNGSVDVLMLREIPTVRMIVERYRARLPAHADADDLLGAGMLGLVEAARKFDPTKAVSFRAYAKHRIRGAILDNLRGIDPLSRDLRRHHRAAEEASAKLSAKLGRAPTRAQIGRHLKVPPARWERIARELYQAGFPVNGHSIASRPAVLVENMPAPDSNPEAAAARSEIRRLLNAAISTLPPRCRQVIALYYLQERTMKEIGWKLGVNESRVSQIHSAAVARMRQAMTERGLLFEFFRL